MLLHSVIALVALPIAFAAPASPLRFQDSSSGFVSILDSAVQQLTEPQHGIVDFSKYTINEILDKALHRKGGEEDDDPASLPLHRLAWILNRSSEAQKSLDGDKLTLLAPDDLALTPPHHSGSNAAPHPFHALDEHVGDHGSDEERRERFAKIVAYILKYHTLDTVETTDELANHSTVPTTLQSETGSVRLRVEATYQILPYPHPILEFNFFVKKRGNTIIAKNGIIHMLSAPLFPPFTPVNDVFLFPTVYSTLTSDLQKVGLAEELLPARRPEGLIAEAFAALSKEEHTSEFTLFAPTNLAMAQIPFEIAAFIHMPFPASKKMLKYLLAYHVVPDITFHSDFIHNNTKLDSFKISQEVDVVVNGANSNVTNYVLPTLLATSGVNPNATLSVKVVEYLRFGKGPIVREISVAQNHHPEEEHSPPVKVWKADGVAKGGAIHAINSLLRPPYEHRGHEDDDAMIHGLNQIFA